MKNNKKLSKVGVGLCGLGIIILIFAFFKMYNLAGDCPNGSAGCKPYSNWHLTNEVALVILVIGILLIIIDSFNRRNS